jgi:hypothetical protein
MSGGHHVICWRFVVFLLIACGTLGAQSPGEPLGSLFDSRLASGLANADSEPGSTSFVLQQLAFGGGWYTALYFANPTASAMSVKADFFDGNGAALSVPILGSGAVSTQTIQLPPNGSIVLEAPNSGNLQQGWVGVEMPSGATGYGVFRQSVSGRADQEAVVPLGPKEKQSATLVWDDSGYTTAIAVVNPSDAPAAVKLDVFQDDGTQVGTVDINLGPKSKTAFNLRDQPGMAGVTGKRGMARFTVTNGAVSVLGLRFAGEAFTSIPAEHK